MRFPGFEAEWEVKKLGDIAKFSKGKGISKVDIDENGEIECIRYGELYTQYGEVIADIKSKTNIDRSHLVFSEGNDVIIPASGETQIDIATASCVLKSGVALGGDLNIIKSSTDGVFLSYYLNSKKKMDIAKLSQGISVVHLYSSQLALLTLNLPSLVEQQKIAKLFSEIDLRITTQKKIIKGLKAFKVQTRNHLIIKIGKEDCESLLIKNILDYEQPTKYIVSNTDYSTDITLTPVLTANKAFILGYTKENFGIYTKGNCIILDDFTMDLKYVNFPFKVKSSAIKILKAKEGVNLKYVFEYFSFLNFSSSEHKRHYISEIEPMSIVLPPIEIQNKIANYLSKIDEKLKIESDIYDLLIQQKKYLLANLFI